MQTVFKSRYDIGLSFDECSTKGAKDEKNRESQRGLQKVKGSFCILIGSNLKGETKKHDVESEPFYGLLIRMTRMPGNSDDI